MHSTHPYSMYKQHAIRKHTFIIYIAIHITCPKKNTKILNATVRNWIYPRCNKYSCDKKRKKECANETFCRIVAFYSFRNECLLPAFICYILHTKNSWDFQHLSFVLTVIRRVVKVMYFGRIIFLGIVIKFVIPIPLMRNPHTMLNNSLLTQQSFIVQII